MSTFVGEGKNFLFIFCRLGSSVSDIENKKNFANIIFKGESSDEARYCVDGLLGWLKCPWNEWVMRLRLQTLWFAFHYTPSRTRKQQWRGGKKKSEKKISNFTLEEIPRDDKVFFALLLLAVEDDGKFKFTSVLLAAGRSGRRQRRKATKKHTTRHKKNWRRDENGELN